MLVPGPKEHSSFTCIGVALQKVLLVCFLQCRAAHYYMLFVIMDFFPFLKDFISISPG